MRLVGAVTDTDGNVTDVAGPVTLSGASGQVSIAGTVQATLRPVLAPAELADGADAGPRLTAWLMSLPGGATADLGGRSYRVETKVKLPDRVGLTVRDGTFYRETNDPAASTNSPNPFVWLLRPTCCTVAGLTVRGPNTVADQRAGFGSYVAARELEAAVRAESFTDLTLTGLDVDGVWGDGVQLQKGTGASLSACRIDRVGRQGVTIIASDVLCDDVQVLHGRRSGFDLEPDSTGQVVSGVEIRNSYTNTIGLPFASGGRGQVNDVWIHHNRSAGSSVPVLYVAASDGSRRSGWRFEDHVAEDPLGSPAAAVRFVNVDGLAVRRVSLPVSAAQSRLAVHLAGCGGPCEVVDSDFGAGGRYRNTSPAPGQALTVARNTPALALVA